MSRLSIFDRKPTIKYRLHQLLVLLTAPGVMLHEFAHELVCIWQRIAIGEVVYFQLDSPAGYVKHAAPRSWFQAFTLAVAPFFINIFTGVWLFSAAFSVLSGGLKSMAIGLVLVWLGFSAVAHSLPSPQDIKNLWEYTTAHVIRYPLVIVVGPIYGTVLLMYKFGMFYISIPLTLSVMAGVLTVFQIEPMAIVECLAQGQWGCWESLSFVELLTSK